MDGAYVALKGYKFQFDKTLLEIFNNPTKVIKIEQIQDYGFDDYYIQVKYHNTDYKSSEQKQKLKKPIIQLIDQFKNDPSKKLILYIYLKGLPPITKVLTTVLELEDIIGKKTKFSLTEKSDFIKKFTLIFANDFETQYKEVIQKIKTHYSKTLEEAGIYYSIISNYLLDIVIKNPPAGSSFRSTSKNEIDQLVYSGKKIIFNSAFIDLLSKEKQLKYLNRLFFRSSLNTEPHERFFIIEIDKQIPIQTIKDVVLMIKTKWSRNKTKIIPDSDRYVPYIFFNGLSNLELAKLKTSLLQDGNIIKDGHDFMDAEFSITSIQEKPTFANRIFFKFINKVENLEKLLSTISRTKEIYQFYFNNQIPILTNDKHIKIEIQDINDIKSII